MLKITAFCNTQTVGCYSINMFNFKEQPYNLLLLTAAFILIASIFAYDQTLDIHLHDTYFIVAMTYLFWATSILLLILWALYLLTKQFLFSKLLTWVHIILTVIALVSFVAISFYSTNYYDGLAGMPRRYYDYSGWKTFERYNNLTKGVFAVMLLISIGLMAYIINIVVGLLRILLHGDTTTAKKWFG
jgi:heme/copper-type cytochrome/quinol oxidase subunit 1